FVLAGPDGSGHGALARLDAGGAPVGAFGTPVVTVPGATTTALEAATVSPGASIFVAGSAHMNGGEHAYVARLKPDGSLDAGFGQSGFMTYGGDDALRRLHT